jgi:hypothetical protein
MVASVAGCEDEGLDAAGGVDEAEEVDEAEGVVESEDGVL